VPDPKYAGRLDYKQGGDTVVTMEKVREESTFNVELNDEFTRLWLTSEQMGMALRQAGGQRMRREKNFQTGAKATVTCYLAPATDFILDENRTSALCYFVL